MKKLIDLATGRIEVHVRRTCFPLDQLCGFSSRNNPKRRYLFVSRVLGKHYPVRPSAMKAIYQTLAKKLADLELPGPVAAIAMAETATGFGQGVFESLLTLTPYPQRIFIHTTRYRLDHKQALQFEEGHCHASEHILYEPQGTQEREAFYNARTLILLDDELTTGNTFANLARAYQAQNPHLEKIVLVTITSWISELALKSLDARMPCAWESISLLEGDFSFTPNEKYQFGPTSKSVGKGDLKDRVLRKNYGRLGLQEPPRLDLKAIRKGLRLKNSGKTLVLGSSEFSFLPYKLAELLEQEGLDVTFQSTTRSPILVDGDIGHKLEFEDNYFDEIDNFLYNVRPGQYENVIACYETSSLPPGHDLPQQLDAQAVFF